MKTSYSIAGNRSVSYGDNVPAGPPDVFEWDADDLSLNEHGGNECKGDQCDLVCCEDDPDPCSLTPSNGPDSDFIVTAGGEDDGF